MANTGWCRKGGARDYTTTMDMHWDIGKRGSGWVLRIPAGREFESSVPRCLCWVFSPDDPHFLKAALIHDTLLERGYRHAFADSQWFEAALSEHAPIMRAWAAYTAMRLRRFAIWSLARGRPNNSTK